jgi:DNA-binding CsgD family transcriptional regulator
MQADADDTIDLLTEIYDAVGNAERWRRLSERFAGQTLPAEIRSHFDVARQAHDQQLQVERDIAILTHVHDRVALGVLAVSGDGHVLAANVTAQRLLAEGGGLRLVEGRLQAPVDAENDKLRRALELGAAGLPGQASAANPFVFVSRPGLAPLSLVLLPIEGRLRVFEEQGTVLVIVIDHGRGLAPNTSILRELFDLTMREAELAWLLAQGRSVHEAAEILAVSINTARTLLSRVTAKTGSHSQAELVQQLLSVPH